MKKLMSTNYSAGAFNFALLLLRFGAGILIINHGYDKLVHFSGYSSQFMPFLGLSPNIALALVIFAEFFCAIFLILGLFTRLSAIPPIIAMSVALFKAHNADVFGKGELATLFLVAFLVIFILGPGKMSVDGLTGK